MFTSFSVVIAFNYNIIVAFSVMLVKKVLP